MSNIQRIRDKEDAIMAKRSSRAQLYQSIKYVCFIYAASLLAVCSGSAEENTALFAAVDKQLISSAVKVIAGTKDAKQERTGSGLIFDSGGKIVCSRYLIAGAETVSVRFFDDNKLVSAKVIGSDPISDIALLEVKTNKSLTAPAPANSLNLKVGDPVAIVRHRDDESSVLSVGTVSEALGHISVLGPYSKFITVNISMSSNDLGGPVFNNKGKMIGILAIFRKNNKNRPGQASAVRTAYVRSVDEIQNVAEQLEKNGKVSRGMLGVLTEQFTKERAQEMGIEYHKGELVAGVMENSPAAAGGVQRGDIIKSFDSIELNSDNPLSLLASKSRIGKKVKLEIIRNNAPKVLEVEIAEAPQKPLSNLGVRR